jgi:hypothetical protein
MPKKVASVGVFTTSNTSFSFDKLFNGKNEGPALELDDSFDDTNRRFVRRI